MLRYRKVYKVLAALWTVLIFVLCLLPGQDLPEVNISYIDKWTHLVLFGVFSFLWMAASQYRNGKRYLVIFLFAAVTGALIEVLQGTLLWLGRSMELADAIADAIGGLLGLLLFALLAGKARTERQ